MYPPPRSRAAQALDCAFLQHTIAATLASGGHSVQLLFAFEYVILASSIVATAAKYVMSMVDAAMEGRWEGKVRGTLRGDGLRRQQLKFCVCIGFYMAVRGA